MKFMFASDIHGSAYYCRKLMEAMEKEQPEKLLLLGDLLYHGPRNDLPREYAPKEVIPMLNSVKDRILAIRGNCDTEVDQMVLEFPVLADYAWFTDGTHTFYLSHGHVWHEGNLPPMQENEIFCLRTYPCAPGREKGRTDLSESGFCVDSERGEYPYLWGAGGWSLLSQRLDGTVVKELAL